MNEWWKSVPNILTIVRLALIPVFVVLMISPSQQMIYLAAGVFVIAAFTDLVDGYIARKWEVVTDLGKLLDPLADKILVMAALVMLVAQRSDVSGTPWVPGWIVVLILAREFWVTGVRGIAASRGIVVAAGGSGKYKSFLQMVAIVLILFHGHSLSFVNAMTGAVVPCELIGMYFLILSVMFSYMGAVDYTCGVFQKERPE
jgi:CDP-diacylglycerol--glycerol-3-phosphate 3-phosphatidyltransferase